MHAGEMKGEVACTPFDETWQKKKPLNEDLRKIFPLLSE
jgi:6-phosphofructokinase 1